jgi:hypothetical protein
LAWLYLARQCRPYEALLKSEIFTGIAGRGIAGYRGIQLFRRNLGEEVEFMTMMWFATALSP